jgi:anaerobic selenocysteine-containing dehydrogenase
VTYSSWRRRGIDTSFLAKPSGRTLDVPTFGRDLAGLADPPARFVYIHGANPVAQFADSQGVSSALKKSGFVVLADAFLTDTADCADLFLPVTLMGEEDGDAVGSFNHHHVCRVRKAIDPPPGVREDVWIVNELNRRLGREDDPLLSRPEEAVERMTAAWFAGTEQSFARNPTHDPVPYAKAFRTPTGRMHLVTDPPGEIDEVDGYPLLLHTPKPLDFEHSQMNPEEQERPFVCRVNPAAPGAEKLEDGQVARLASPSGSMEVRVKFDPELGENLCVVRVGGWLRYGRAVNALVEPRATDMGYGTAFYDQRGRLEPR